RLQRAGREFLNLKTEEPLLYTGRSEKLGPVQVRTGLQSLATPCIEQIAELLERIVPVLGAQYRRESSAIGAGLRCICVATSEVSVCKRLLRVGSWVVVGDFAW